MTVIVALVLGLASSVSGQASATPEQPPPDITVPHDLLDADALDRVPELREPALDYAQVVPGFAGTYIDSAAADSIVFLFTDPTPDIANQLRDLLDPEISARLRVETVEHSLADLTEAKQRVSDLIVGSDVLQGVGLSISNNALIVMSTLASDETETLIRSELSIAVPIVVEFGTVQETLCNNRFNCGGTNDRRGACR